MKMKIVDVIRKTSDEQIATIIGAIVAQGIDGISAEEAIKLDYPNTLRELQREIEIDYKQTNADRIRSMNDEELAEFLCKVKADYQWTDHEFPSEEECGEWEEWLQSEVEE